MIRILATTTQLKGPAKIEEECNLVLGTKETGCTILGLKHWDKTEIYGYKYNLKRQKTTSDSLLSIQSRVVGQSKPARGLTVVCGSKYIWPDSLDNGPALCSGWCRHYRTDKTMCVECYYLIIIYNLKFVIITYHD